MRIVGVMGPGVKEATLEDLECAYKVGQMVAETNAALLCGGMKGTMEASAKGAKEAGGLTMGIGPTDNKADQNEYIDLKLVTNMHAGRNYMNIASSDVLVFVSIGSPGTLSELAHAIQMKKPSLVIRGSEALKSYVKELDSESIEFVDDLDQLSNKLNEILETI